MSADSLTHVGDALVEFIRRYLSITDDQAATLALFIIHTHAFEAAETTPYLSISSVGPAAGKTKVLEILEMLVANPWLTGRVTGAALVRKVDAEHPTLLLDETDALFNSAGTSQQMLRGVLNSGYRLGGKTTYASGGKWVDLDTYCPKAFAGIGTLPATLADRSIPILMKKRTAFDAVERMRVREVRVDARLPKMLAARFAAVRLERLTRARPEIPSALDDRAADVWEPLLAIADELGGSWPERARAAAVNLCAGRKDAGQESVAFRLLVACRDAFAAFEADRLKTVTLLGWLLESEEWADMDGRPLDARLMADALRPFGVSVSKIRFGRQTLQGYARRDFASAWRMLGLAEDEDRSGVPPVPAEREEVPA